MSDAKYAMFIKAVDKKSLALAAQELCCTPSAVSHGISALETELGLRLMKRSRGGVELTAEGEHVIGAVRGVLAAMERVQQAAEEARQGLGRIVRIGAFTSVAVHWLPGMIKSFEQVCPQAQFKLLNGDYHDIDTWLGDGSVDLAFTTLPARPGCRCTPLYEDALAAVLPKGHPLGQSPVCRVEELAKEPFISLLESSNHDVRRAFHAVKARPNIRFETKDDYAVIAMVRQGLGVSIMPSLLLRGNTDGVEIRPIDPPASRTIALAAATDAPAATRFADFAVHWVRENT